MEQTFFETRPVHVDLGFDGLVLRKWASMTTMSLVTTRNIKGVRGLTEVTEACEDNRERTVVMYPTPATGIRVVGGYGSRLNGDFVDREMRWPVG